MESRSFHRLAVIPFAGAALAAALGLTACASQSSNPNSPANIKTETASAELRSDRIRSWSVLNDQTMIIESYDGTRYKAETMGACNGLSFATRLGFSNRGGFKTVDRFSSVLLPDGTRCPLASLNKVITAEKSALDSYEKAEQEKDAAAGKDKQGESSQKDDAKKDDPKTEQSSGAAGNAASTEGQPKESASPR